MCVLSIIQERFIAGHEDASIAQTRGRFVSLSDPITHTRTASPPSVSADSAGTSVMFAGLMMAFIYHGNAHEAVRGALADVGGIPDVLITCCTSLNRDVCSAIAAVKESVRMA